MKNTECINTHTDSYIVSKEHLEYFQKMGWISKTIDGLLGCHKCGDFYELVKIPSVVTTILSNVYAPPK